MDSLIGASRSRGGLDETALDLIDRVGVSEGDPDGLVREVLTTTLAVLPCAHPLLLLQTDDGCMRLYTALDDGAVLGMSYGEDDTVLTRALRSTRPVFESGLEDVDAGRVLGRMFRASSLIAAPLRYGGRTTGVLGIVDPIEGDAYEQLTHLRVIAARAAVALGGSAAHDRLRREVEDSEFLLNKLYRSDQNKTELLSVVSHEVKNPVTNIIGFGRALAKDWATIEASKRERFLQVIVREGQRAARLVEDVLDLARLESGSFKCDLAPTSVAEVIDEVLAANSAWCDKHVVSVAVDADIPVVSADADRLGQVVRNLLSNACHYAPVGTQVWIRATTINDGSGLTVLVSVRDEGPGIPEDEQPRLFDKFERLSTSAGADKGAGLGLFISKGIVEAHGGQIWVKSRPGEGTTFHFTLRSTSA